MPSSYIHQMHSIRQFVFRFDNIFRLFVVPGLAFVLAHLVAYKALPLQEGYVFPTRAFINILLFGYVVCEFNRFNYRWIDRGVKLPKNSMKRIALLTGLNVVSSTLIFTLLTFILFGTNLVLVSFLNKLMVILLISIIETCIFIIRDLFLLNKPNAKRDKRLIINSGKKTIQIPEEDIAYFFSSGGIVTLVDRTGRKIITQFSALAEAEIELNSTDFFQLNRQYIVRMESIKEVVKDTNRKLKVIVEPAEGCREFITVSRYRRNEFQQWFLAS